MQRHALTDEQWARLQPLLPSRAPGRKSTRGDRLFVDAVIFRELRIDVDETASIADGSVVRAHQDASGGKGGSNAMLWDALVDGFSTKISEPSPLATTRPRAASSRCSRSRASGSGCRSRSRSRCRARRPSGGPAPIPSVGARRDAGLAVRAPQGLRSRPTIVRRTEPPTGAPSRERRGAVPREASRARR
jgi:hypothetical protein